MRVIDQAIVATILFLSNILCKKQKSPRVVGDFLPAMESLAMQGVNALTGYPAL
jgi:hypothetical protein